MNSSKYNIDNFVLSGKDKGQALEACLEDANDQWNLLKEEFSVSRKIKKKIISLHKIRKYKKTTST